MAARVWFSLLVFVLAGCDRGLSAADASPPAPSSASSERAVAPAPAPAPPRPAGSSELALVAPLVAGSELEGFSVRAVLGVEGGVLVVECQKERARVRLLVALAADDGPEPPASAGRYVVFYSARGAEPDDSERLAKALAAILEKHADVPTPAGLTKFVPSPIPI